MASQGEPCLPCALSLAFEDVPETLAPELQAGFDPSRLPCVFGRYALGPWQRRWVWPCAQWGLRCFGLDPPRQSPSLPAWCKTRSAP